MPTCLQGFLHGCQERLHEFHGLKGTDFCLNWILIGPRMGSNRAQNAAKHLGELFDFFGFWMYLQGFFVGFIYSKMANVDFRTYCNTFWIIFGTSNKKRAKWPPVPLFITEILRKIKRNMDAFYKNIILVNQGSKRCDMVLKMHLPVFYDER